MNFTIRDATSADLPAIQTLLAATWHDTYDGIYGKDRVTEITDRWHSMEALELGLRLPQSYFPVAVSGEKIVATALARFDESRVIDLRRLYVHPKFQRKGLGGALLQVVIDKFPEAIKMTLEVEPQNTNACAFYQHRAFHVTRQTVLTVGAGRGSSEESIPCQVMERSLGRSDQ